MVEDIIVDDGDDVEVVQPPPQPSAARVHPPAAQAPPPQLPSASPAPPPPPPGSLFDFVSFAHPLSSFAPFDGFKVLVKHLSTVYPDFPAMLEVRCPDSKQNFRLAERFIVGDLVFNEFYLDKETLPASLRMELEQHFKDVFNLLHELAGLLTRTLNASQMLEAGKPFGKFAVNAPAAGDIYRASTAVGRFFCEQMDKVNLDYQARTCRLAIEAYCMTVADKLQSMQAMYDLALAKLQATAADCMSRIPGPQFNARPFRNYLWRLNRLWQYTAHHLFDLIDKESAKAMDKGLKRTMFKQFQQQAKDDLVTEGPAQPQAIRDVVKEVVQQQLLHQRKAKPNAAAAGADSKSPPRRKPGGGDGGGGGGGDGAGSRPRPKSKPKSKPLPKAPKRPPSAAASSKPPKKPLPTPPQRGNGEALGGKPKRQGKASNNKGSGARNNNSSARNVKARGSAPSRRK